MEKPVENSLAASLIAAHYGNRQGCLAIGGVSVAELAIAYGTPMYVYDAEILRENHRRLSKAVAGFAEVYFSIKANPNPHVAEIFVREGAGLEVASGAEFATALQAGCKPERVLFAGPGKGEAELRYCLERDIGEIHLESFEEIEIVGAIAAGLGKKVPVAVRINPVAAAAGGAMRMGGKPAAFGFDEEIIDEVVAAIGQHPDLFLSGVHLFAGTQILNAETLLTQWAHGLEIAAKMAAKLGRPLHTIDLGGGLGVPYHTGDEFLDLDAVAAGVPALRQKVAADALLKDAHVILEPGRFLAASAGIYVMQVRAVKQSRGERFIISDGGMHHHLAASGNLGQVIKRDYPIIAADRLNDSSLAPANIVGPLCTPLDTLGRKTTMPQMQKGDLIAVLQSGAYGLTASPNAFLSQPMAAEVLVDQGKHRAIRSIGTIERPWSGSAD